MRWLGAVQAVCGLGLLFAACACGGKSKGVPGADGGASAQGGTGNQAGGGSGGAEAQRCHAFDDDLATSVIVNISNRTRTPLYLGDMMGACGSEPSPLFVVGDASGVPLTTVNPCRLPCQTPDVGGCTLVCASPRTVLLEPGEVYTTSWSGLYGTARELPSSCAEVGTEAIQCQQAKRIEPGTFQFTAVAGTSRLCSQVDAAGACMPCTPVPEGGCVTVGSTLASGNLQTSTTVSLNEAYGVYPAPAADPSSGSGAGPGSGNIAQLSVELVFETPP